MSGRARGQATVELALGTLVFVTVLAFGIHFAELGIMKLRVQQAASSALWDTTGLRAHDYSGNTPRFFQGDQLRDSGGRTPEARARALYQDFDGFGGAGDQLKLVFTRGSNLRVSCEGAQVAPMPGRGEAFDVLSSAYRHPSAGGRTVDGMQCNASALISVAGIPSTFMEGSGGFFQTANVIRPAIPVCAFGRARGGECRGAVRMAIDDWGLSGSGGGREWAQCDEKCLFGTQGNRAYVKTVRRLYEDYEGLRERNAFTLRTLIATLFTKSPEYPYLNQIPTDERTLRFVFIGEDGTGPRRPGDDNGPGYEPFKPFHYGTREVSTTDAFNYSWASTPYSDRYREAYQGRGRCFLGSSCSRPLFDKKSW